jgi:Protein involved in formate dehydrogenase formation
MSAERRLRAEALRERHPFAADLLTLYLALLPVQEDARRAAAESPPAPAELARWAAERVVPAIVDATVAAGPAALGEAVRERLADGEVERTLAAWLAGEELDPVARYLSRASLAPVLEEVGAAAHAPATAEACPHCGGPPQLSWLAASGDKLVSGHRSLLCARCGWSWKAARSMCPACGESEEEKLVVYAEQLHGAVSGNGAQSNGSEPVFPHMRVAACSTCSRYLIEVDLGADGRAVPEVDELAALPLDLHASDQGLQKVTPNLMGF